MSDRELVTGFVTGLLLYVGDAFREDPAMMTMTSLGVLAAAVYLVSALWFLWLPLLFIIIYVKSRQ
jgi:hypothetical protein